MIPKLVSSRRFTFLVYATLAIIILWQLLLPGYILTLDMVFAPHINLDLYTNPLHANELPLIYVLAALSAMIPVWLLQKAILFGILFLSGIGMHRFVFNRIGRLAPAYFAGILYMVNPFTYSRFLAGQWLLLAGYALVPFAISAFIGLLERDKHKKIEWKFPILLTCIAICSLHMLALTLLVCLILGMFRAVESVRKHQVNWKIVKQLTISAIIFLALNSYWLVLSTVGQSQMETITSADIGAFNPTSAGGNIFLTVADMWGFWRGDAWYGPLTLWLVVPIIALAVYGAVHSWKSRITKGIVLTAIVAFLLAVGASGWLTEGFFKLLFEAVPGFAAFRDSHKFVALLVFAYAYLGALGFSKFTEFIRPKLDRRITVGLMLVILLVPLANSYPMLFGFSGQLQPTDYPADWYEIEALLTQDTTNFTTLFLPWHLYTDFSWLPNTDKRIGTPASAFFTKPILQGDNIEIGGIYTQSNRSESGIVENILAERDNITDFGSRLVPLNVKYVILAKEADWQNYAFLYNQTGLAQISETKTLILFKNLAFQA